MLRMIPPAVAHIGRNEKGAGRTTCRIIQAASATLAGATIQCAPIIMETQVVTRTVAEAEEGLFAVQAHHARANQGRAGGAASAFEGEANAVTANAAIRASPMRRTRERRRRPVRVFLVASNADIRTSHWGTR
jgi:hypothetical protein